MSTEENRLALTIAAVTSEGCEIILKDREGRLELRVIGRKGDKVAMYVSQISKLGHLDNVLAESFFRVKEKLKTIKPIHLVE